MRSYEREVRRLLKSIGFSLRVVGFNPSEWKLTDLRADRFGYRDGRSAAYFPYMLAVLPVILAAAHAKRAGKPNTVWVSAK